MSDEPLRLPGGRNLLCCRSQWLGGGSHQPVFPNWAVGSQKPIACFLARCQAFISATFLEHSWFRVRNSGHQVGEVLMPLMYTLTHSLGHLTGSGIWDVWCVSEFLMVAGPADGSVQTWVCSLGSCGVLLVILFLWDGHLGSYSRACSHKCRQTLSATLLIGSTFRPFKEVSQVCW